MINTMMASSLFRTTRQVALVAAVALACSASFAEKSDGHGGHNAHGDHGGKHGYKKHKDKDDHQSHRAEHRPVVNHYHKGSRPAPVRVGGYFVDHQRVVINNYYGEQFREGRCPPGLAKKNNGCLPPGKAKKYWVGQPLPREVVYHTVPQPVSTQLGTPPAGYRYVRVDSDILLLGVGSSMVIDAIQNLGGL